MSMTPELELALSAIDRSIRALRELKYPEQAAELSEARAAVSAHLTQPAQSVDVEKVREVIENIRRCAGNNNANFHRSWADKLTAALQESDRG